MWALLALHAPPARAQRLEPPRVEVLPVLELDDGTPPPEGGAVEAVVEVDRDGRATLVSTDAAGALRDRLTEALGGARFAPATRDGEPVRARVTVRLVAAAATPGAEPPPVTSGGPPPEYGAVARVRRDHRPGGVRLELEELRAIPGAFGDPMRVLDTLPGTVPETNGLPYAYVRGAPPAGSAYLYDGIRMPGLFHLFGGPGYVHPRLIGPVTTYRGVAPARYGRRVGAVLSGEGPGEPAEVVTGELEVRALDVNGVVSAPVSGGAVAVGGRYGYPGPLISAFVPELDPSYWDYQLRLDVPVSDAGDRAQVVWLGVFDSLVAEDFGEEDDTPERIDILFHRGEARYVSRRRGGELGVAFGVGQDASEMNAVDVRVRSVRAGPRLWLERRLGPGARVRVGADLEAVVGEVDGFDGDGLPGDEGTQIDNPAFADAPTRSASGAYVELGLASGVVELEAGARADLYVVGSNTAGALEPRVAVAVRPARWLELHAGAGLAHQQAVFFLPLPGLTQIALDEGLQRAAQLEGGVAFDLPAGVRVGVDAFVTRFEDLLLFELFEVADCSAGPPAGSPFPCTDEPGIPRAAVLAYGGELFVKVALADRLLVWGGYTLSRAEAEAENGVSFTPEMDARHVLNAVVAWNVAGGFRVGLRGHYRTGRVGSAIVQDPLRYHAERLPGVFRLDARLSYRWTTSWGRMEALVEWFNTTLTREPEGLECPGDRLPCRVDHGPRLFYPNAGVRAEF